MNFELEEILNNYVKRNDLDSAIQIAESELSKIGKTDFHQLIGMNLLHMEAQLSEFISKFYSSVKLKYTLSFTRKLKAFYCEMNGFTINYDRWFINMFSYSEIREQDSEWLAHFECQTKNDLTIIGLENIQKVYEDYYRNKKFKILEIKQAHEVSELLIILRLQELFRETYINAKLNEKKWIKLPMFVTAHDYEMVYRTKLANGS